MNPGLIEVLHRNAEFKRQRKGYLAAYSKGTTRRSEGNLHKGRSRTRRHRKSGRPRC